MSFYYSELRSDTKYFIFSMAIFTLTLILAMLSHFFAKYYEMMGLTITGWGFATIGGIQLGSSLTNSRVWNLSGKKINTSPSID